MGEAPGEGPEGAQRGPGEPGGGAPGEGPGGGHSLQIPPAAQRSPEGEGPGEGPERSPEGPGRALEGKDRGRAPKGGTRPIWPKGLKELPIGR